MRRLLFFFLLFPSIICKSQTGSFTDTRDGHVYSTINAGNKKWFRENLAFQTSKSFCPNYNKSGKSCNYGNFYSNEELTTVCPAGWHVATIQDWEEYVHVVMQKHNIDSSLFKYDTSGYFSNHYTLRLEGFNFYKDTLLNLHPAGWIEGVKWKKGAGLSLWVVDKETNDPKYHIHGASDAYIKHTHDHNIIDMPSRVRKFSVRCVCDTLMK